MPARTFSPTTHPSPARRAARGRNRWRPPLRCAAGSRWGRQAVDRLFPVLAIGYCSRNSVSVSSSPYTEGWTVASGLGLGLTSGLSGCFSWIRLKIRYPDWSHTRPLYRSFSNTFFFPLFMCFSCEIKAMNPVKFLRSKHYPMQVTFPIHIGIELPLV